jgi:hypothetical protein
MYTIILIEKEGTLVQKQVKSFDKLHTTCNYRNNNNFELLHTWTVTTEVIYQLFGKKIKKLNNENCYTFQGIQDIYYGNLCIVKRTNNEPTSITISEWESFHGTFCVQSSETNEVVEPEVEEIPYTVSDDKELVHEEYEEE